MAKKPKIPVGTAKSVTPNRAARLYRLLSLLAKEAQPHTLVRRLKVGVRDFYRDLIVLETVDIGVQLVQGRYLLTEPASKAL